MSFSVERADRKSKLTEISHIQKFRQQPIRGQQPQTDRP